jgi:hypothetical protein
VPHRPALPIWRLLALVGLALACNGSGAPAEPATSAGAASAGELTPCPEPRPEMCTMDYVPVCGRRGAEWKTYPNACGACSDPAVSGFRAGPCGGQPTPRQAPPAE